MRVSAASGAAIIAVMEIVAGGASFAGSKQEQRLLVFEDPLHLSEGVGAVTARDDHEQRIAGATGCQNVDLGGLTEDTARGACRCRR